MAAGATGLLAHPLRHALTLSLAAAALLCGWPDSRPRWRGWAELLAAAAVFLLCQAAGDRAVNALGVAALAVGLVRQHGGHRHGPSLCQ